MTARRDGDRTDALIDRAIEDRLTAYLPSSSPPLDDVLRRHRRRRTRRASTGALVVVVATLVPAVSAVDLSGGADERRLAASPGEQSDDARVPEELSVAGPLALPARTPPGYRYESVSGTGDGTTLSTRSVLLRPVRVEHLPAVDLCAAAAGTPGCATGAGVVTRRLDGQSVSITLTGANASAYRAYWERAPLTDDPRTSDLFTEPSTADACIGVLAESELAVTTQDAARDDRVQQAVRNERETLTSEQQTAATRLARAVTRAARTGFGPAAVQDVTEARQRLEGVCD